MELKENLEEVKITRSEKTQEILSSPPPFLIQSGNLILFSFFTLILLLSLWIKIPVYIRAKMQVHFQNPPVIYKPKDDGFIKTIFVKNNSTVEKNEKIMLLATSENQEEIVYATTSGKINYQHYWSINQKVNSGESIFLIEPNNLGFIIGRTYLSKYDLDKVTLGKNFLLKTKNDKDGLIMSKVVNIGKIPNNENKYSVDFLLSNGINNNRLSYTEDLEILIEKETLFNKFKKSIFSNF